jgi:hypothetical protein
MMCYSTAIYPLSVLYTGRVREWIENRERERERETTHEKGLKTTCISQQQQQQQQQQQNEQ